MPCRLVRFVRANRAIVMGEAKVSSGLWVSIEDVAAGVATSGTVSAKKVSILSTAVATVEASVVVIVAASAAATGLAVAAGTAAASAVVTGSAAAAAAAAAVFGSLVKEGLMSIQDMSRRERAIFAPLIIMTLLLGIYPALVTDLIGPSVKHLVTDYQTAIAALAQN